MLRAGFLLLGCFMAKCFGGEGLFKATSGNEYGILSMASDFSKSPPYLILISGRLKS